MDTSPQRPAADPTRSNAADLGPAKVMALLVGAVTLSMAASLIVTSSNRAKLPEGPATTTESQPVTNGLTGDVIPTLTPKGQLQVVPATETNVAVAPNMPPASGRTDQAIVDVTFEVVETTSTIDAGKGTQAETWGYRVVGGDEGALIGTPGPVVRARVGDVLRFTIINPEGNQRPHNVDFHAVTGQGGGAEATTVNPGETRTIEARLLYPGFFLYHCAFGDVPAHIAHGMTGGILVDPAEPLPAVDHEWYVIQSEYYLGADGTLDRAAVTNETPSHVVFNGAVGAIAGDNALQMDVGQRARIYFVNGGLNLISSFHPIGSHWDAVYPEAALLNAPLRGSQTTLVPAGGATVVDIVGQVPQTVVLVDHALSRAFDKGAIGQIVISGNENTDIFEEVEPGPISERPTAAPTTPAPAATGAGEQYAVSMVPGAGTFQELDSPDEFAENEAIPDYDINVLEIKVGDTVTWTNDDPGMVHTVTDVNGGFDSGFLNAGETWSYTFTEVGEFEYFCIPHPWMRAKVIVTA